MADLALSFGADLAFTPAGDLALSTGPQAGQERVLRRLLTPPGAYLWHTAYGAGLPQMVGSPALAERIAGVVLRQMRREAAVRQEPPPSVAVAVDPAGTVTASVAYVDAATGQPAQASVR